MTTLSEAFSRKNLERAWRWIKSNPDAGYKSYCSRAYSRFALADEELLGELRDKLYREIYEPSYTCKVFLPKKSGILRPYTILTVEDQIVYQAMVNIIAERLAPRVRGQYLRVTFGHMYAGKSSVWFYRQWRRGYSAFNKAARGSFRRGLKFAASFDLTACYDSLDYEVLCHFLKELKCDSEFCGKLKEYLGIWAATDTRIFHSHGIPQGPLGSGLLAEVVLRHFDLNFGTRSNVRYLRYVDDIRLFASREDDLRRLLVRLDTLSKDVGLFPQAAKINIHKIEDIEKELKSIGYAYEAEEEDESHPDQDHLRREIIELTRRFSVKDDTKFKHLLTQADPSFKLNERLLRISLNRPDLVPNAMRYFRKYDRLPPRVARDLLDRLGKEPLYESTTAEILTTLDQRTPRPFAATLRRMARKKWKPRSSGTALKAAVGRLLFREKLLEENRIRYALRTIRDWWVRAELFCALTPKAFGTVFLENVLNDGVKDKVGDAALSAAETLASNGLRVTVFPRKINRSAARVLRRLRIISTLPKGIDGVELNLSRIIGRPTGIHWRPIFGKDYKQAEKQAVFCRAQADTNPTAFVNAADVFNDLLVYRLYRHDRSLGTYVLGNIGSILSSTRLRSAYPALHAFVSDIHEKRYISNLSHARARRTGKPTGRIKYQYVSRAKGLMRRALDEIAAKW